MAPVKMDKAGRTFGRMSKSAPAERHAIFGHKPSPAETIELRRIVNRFGRYHVKPGD